MIKDTKSLLESFWSSDKFATLFSEAKSLADNLDVVLRQPRIPKRSVHRGIPIQSTDTSNVENAVEVYYRVNFYYPAIDAILQDMNLRFGTHQETVVHFCRVIPALIGSNIDENWSNIVKALRSYQPFFIDSAEMIKAEYQLWCKKWESIEFEKGQNLPLKLYSLVVLSFRTLLFFWRYLLVYQ